jgi:hypothetical protein
MIFGGRAAQSVNRQPRKSLAGALGAQKPAHMATSSYDASVAARTQRLFQNPSPSGCFRICMDDDARCVWYGRRGNSDHWFLTSAVKFLGYWPVANTKPPGETLSPPSNRITDTQISYQIPALQRLSLNLTGYSSLLPQMSSKEG